MTYLRVLLAGVAALFAAMLLPGLLSTLRGLASQKATALGGVLASMWQSPLSPQFWLLALVFFALFFAASRLQSQLWRALLFWVPAGMMLLSGVTRILVSAVLWWCCVRN